MQHTLFFIDDRPDTVEMVKAHLPSQLWAVTGTTSAETAREIFKTTGFDIYLFDVALQDNPDVPNKEDGNQLAEDLKKAGPSLHYSPMSPIVFMTKIRLEREIVQSTGGRKWEKTFGNYRIPRVGDPQELSALLEIILKRHRDEMKASGV